MLNGTTWQLACFRQSCKVLQRNELDMHIDVACLQEYLSLSANRWTLQAHAADAAGLFFYQGG